MYSDPTVPLSFRPCRALILALIAQHGSRSAYRRYLRVPNSRGITGPEAPPS